MMLTIIPEDKFVNINGRKFILDFTTDPNYHAIHWDGTNGFIETKEGANILLTDVNEFQSIIDLHAQTVVDEDARIAAEQIEYNLPSNVWARQMIAVNLKVATIEHIARFLEDYYDDNPDKLAVKSQDFKNALLEQKTLRSQKP